MADDPTPEGRDPARRGRPIIASRSPGESWSRNRGTSRESRPSRPKPGGYLKTFGKVGTTETVVVTSRTDMAGITGIKLEARPDFDQAEGGTGTASDGSFLLTEFKLFITPDVKDAKPIPVPILSAAADRSEDGKEVDRAIDGDDRSGWSGGRGDHSTSRGRVRGDRPADGAGIGAGEDHGPIGVPFLPAAEEPRILPALCHLGPGPRDAMGPRVREVGRRPGSISTNTIGDPVADYILATSPAFASLIEPSARRRCRAKEGFVETLPKSMVAVSGMPRPTRILPRGNWMSDDGDLVEPGFPAFLPQSSIKKRRLDRLDLAAWIVISRQPVARPGLHESPVEDDVRPGAFQGPGRPRCPGRVAHASRVARLAGGRVHGIRLGRQAHDPAARHLRHLSPDEPGHSPRRSSATRTIASSPASRDIAWTPRRSATGRCGSRAC